MLNLIRDSKSTKIFWGLMLFYLLNISVDTVDLNPEYIPEDLSFNDQESIIEIILEQVLGFEDAIKEYDDYDTRDKKINNSFKIDLLVYFNNASTNLNTLQIKMIEFYTHNEPALLNGFREIESPPPKV